MQARSVSFCNVQALQGGCLPGPVVIPVQELINNRVFVDLVSSENAACLTNFFMTQQERLALGRRSERIVFRWPLLQSLKKSMIEALRHKDLEDEQSRQAGIEERSLDLGFGAEEETVNKRRIIRSILPLGKSQVVVVPTLVNGKSAQIPFYCRKRLKGLWVEQSQQTFEFLWDAFRYWRDAAGGVSQLRLPVAGGDAKGEEEGDPSSDGCCVRIRKEPRWWRSMWVFKFRIEGNSTPHQKTFTVKASDEPSEFALRKKTRFEDALAWRSDYIKRARAQAEDSEGTGGKASASEAED